jgi:hypothetical protein
VKKGKRKAECHPNRAHYAKGLCASCYHAQAVKKKKKHQPVRVTHTHDVIREVANMSTKKEEEKEQEFFAEKVKEQEQNERKHTMAAAHEEPKEVKAEPLKRAEGASKESVVSPAGTTEPTPELGGDGVTPKAEWDKKYAELKKKQDELDEKRRQRAVEDSGIIQTTEKHGVK